MDMTIRSTLLLLSLCIPMQNSVAGGLLGTLPGQPKQPALSQPSPSLPAPNVLAHSMNGNLTQDSVDAYIEALQFCLAQLGQNKQFTPQERATIKQSLVQAYPGLDPEAQRELADARNIWNRYRNQWQMLPMQEKKAFAYDVLALAYGDAAAAQALGMNQGGGGQYNSQGGYSSQGSYGAPGVGSYSGSDCWASAGCTDYDSGSGTYTYESYDYDSGSYYESEY